MKGKFADIGPIHIGFTIECVSKISKLVVFKMGF